MIDQILQKIGLTKNEIKVYGALLDLGETKTGEILAKSELNSGKIYEILDSLQKKGLVSCITKNNIKYFSPADPKRVFDYIKEKKNDLTNQEDEFKKILPELLSKISSKKGNIKIEIFTGFNGMKTAMLKEEEYYKKGEILYVSGLLKKEAYDKKIYDIFVYNVYPKRESSGIKIKKLYSEDARKDKGISEKNAEIRYIPYEYTPAINIIKNLTNISISAGEETIIISIESADVARGFIEQFELLWKIAKK